MVPIVLINMSETVVVELTDGFVMHDIRNKDHV